MKWEKIDIELGLNLVKKIERKRGGKIELKCKADQGSVSKVALSLRN